LVAGATRGGAPGRLGIGGGAPGHLVAGVGRALGGGAGRRECAMRAVFSGRVVARSRYRADSQPKNTGLFTGYRYGLNLGTNRNPKNTGLFTGYRHGLNFGSNPLY
jgi:hypothetical protein